MAFKKQKCSESPSAPGAAGLYLIRKALNSIDYTLKLLYDATCRTSYKLEVHYYLSLKYYHGRRLAIRFGILIVEVDEAIQFSDT